MKKRIACLISTLCIMGVTLNANALAWNCTSCGAENEGNFCSNCGAANTITWFCSSCSQENNGNFCTNCGKSKTSMEGKDLSSVSIGDTIEFGSYEQDNDLSNGKEDIEWKVLDVQDGKALLISRYALDCEPYNTEDTDVTWETCTLREWLNEEFYTEAFSESQREQIQKTYHHTEDNKVSGIAGGNDTEDHIFLLSIEEVGAYYGIDPYNKERDERLAVKPTEYAMQQGADVVTREDIEEYPDYLSSSDEGNCWWWLRSPGVNSYHAAYVRLVGSVGCGGYCVCFGGGCVRPALWIDLT